MKNTQSSQRRRITAFAMSWARADLGPGYHAHGGMRLAHRVHTITSYATNWLAQHGEMPTGVHIAHAAKPIFRGSDNTIEVDFTPLHRFVSE